MRTRFAPSPTGPLHLGHAYSAIVAHDMALRSGGDFVLRIEDIDQTRARPEWEEQIFEDLRWLGLSWEQPVMRQSERLDVYHKALQALWDRGLLFACHCNRKDIEEAAWAPQEGGAVLGPDGLVYPGTCRNTEAGRDHKAMPEGCALRLDMSQATLSEGSSPDTDMPDAGRRRIFQFTEAGRGPEGQTGLVEFSADDMTTKVGDVVLARRDMGTSYHLSVVLDDAAQDISHVVRGEDLFEASKIHVVLQHLLGLTTPLYHHHKLIRDEAGRRLAKRDDARSIRTYRDDGASPQDIRAMVGL